MLKDYLISDYYRIWGEREFFLIVALKAICALNPAFTFMFWFRLAKVGGWHGLISRRMYRHYCSKFQVYMPLDVEVGYGCYLGHCMCMVIGNGTKIGNNCNLSQFLNIGSNSGKSAVIGDNVYIGPHVCVVEDVKIGDNVTIGAGTIVVKDIPANSTAVGNPARVISMDNPARFITNCYES